MTRTQAMRELKALGTEQNRTVYARHGATGVMFGVSYGNLGKLKKRVKIDHELALALWETGNHDARVFATMIADASSATKKQLSAWSKDLDSYVTSDALASFVARTPHARALAEKWRGARGEWIAAAGWNLTSGLTRTATELPDTYFGALIPLIEERIHNAKNRVRYAMNGTLIGIGIRSPGLQRKAVAAAKRIGKVEVDHGETGCKTPDAIPYIAKAVARKNASRK